MFIVGKSFFSEILSKLNIKTIATLIVKIGHVWYQFVRNMSAFKIFVELSNILKMAISRNIYEALHEHYLHILKKMFKC